MFSGPAEARRRRARETWKAVLKVFIMAVVLDYVYQLLVFRWVYPIEKMVTAVILAILPYVLLRGLFTALHERGSSRNTKGASR